jgi:predicted lipoprotein with Yx(FWY)xxD motif
LVFNGTEQEGIVKFRRWFAIAASGAVLAIIFASAALAARPSDAATTVSVALSAKYGNILVDSAGFTVYTLSTESGGKITCTATCLTAWPPILLAAGATTPTGGTGVTGTLGTVTRADGSKQATYNGFPIYDYLGDSKAGDTTGEGVVSFGGTWHLVQITPAPAPQPTPTPPANTPLVQIADNPTLGNILVTQAGLSLYYNTAESPTKSVCTGKCEATWPPLVLPAGATAPTGASGITGHLSTTTRTDGSQQVMYNNAPLYQFVRDAKVGDIGGNGIRALGGVWFAAHVNYTPLSATPAVQLTLNITAADSMVWGKVTAHYSVHGKTLNTPCASATCTLVLPPGVAVKLTQKPLNSTTWAFKAWHVSTITSTRARVLRSSAITLKANSSVNVTAIYSAR